jgi:endonuclease III
MRLQVKVQDYNLNNTMLPSFISSLYVLLNPLRNQWRKKAGYLGGKLELMQSKRDIIEVKCTAEISKKTLLEYILLETGIWHDPFEKYLSKLPSKVRSKAEALAELYPGVRLPVAARDFDYLLIAIALSKRASYYNFVLHWCKELFQRFGADLNSIANLPEFELRRIGNSYQLFELQKTLQSYIKLFDRDTILKLSPEAARKALMNCYGLGPKTVDSLILSTFKAPHFIPCDVHLKNVFERLEVIPKKSEMPLKKFCSRYFCETCPRAEVCIRSKLSFLGDLGGWMQTLAYLHGSRYCHSYAPKCRACRICN